MCGRIKQAKTDRADYMETMRVNDYTILADESGPRYNVAPGTKPAVIHRLDGGKWIMDRLFWGYGPAWYERQPVRNARLDKILANSPFWRGPLAHGRIIVPADGWYEWTGEKGDKQPWYIKPKDGKPLLFAAISGWKIGADAEKESGFAIVTDDSAGGMVDIHDRRPLSLAPDDAIAWVDPELPVNEALELLSAPRSESAFVWHQVTRAMGNSRYQGADSSEPI